jgi:SAM-dependent methyltransferase
MDIRSGLTQKLLAHLSAGFQDELMIKIAVVGGSIDEPELKALQAGLNTTVHFFGIEKSESENFTYLDLNEASPVMGQHAGQFDLILCSQVLEHLWNLPQAFVHFNSLLKSGGAAWVACPYSNFFHGSPHFYSTGYSPELIIKLAESQGMHVPQSGFVGSQRLYRSRHLLAYWLSERQLNHPLTSYFGIPGSPLAKLLFNFKIIPERIILAMTPNIESTNEFDAVETWALITKP